MKENIENILNDVVTTISAALYSPEKPIERELSWTGTLASLLNLMIGELFPGSAPVAFSFNQIKQKSYLKIGLDKRHPLSRDPKMIFGTLLKQIEKMKQLFLTESAWQLTRDLESYFIPAIPNNILVAWLALCIKQINTSHPIENGLMIEIDPPKINVSGSVGNLLRQQLGFYSICTQDEHAILQQLHNELERPIEQFNLLGDLQYSNDHILKQLEYCEKISTVISNRITARSVYHYNQLMKAHLKLILVSNITHKEKLQSVGTDQLISHLNYIEHTCTNLPLAEVDDYILPLIIENLLEIIAHYPILIEQSTISEVENNNIEKPTINMDMLQKIFDRIMEHCRVCINEDNNKRLDIICDKLQTWLTTCLHELTTPPSLITDKIITMLNSLFKLITPPPYRAWQNTILNTLQKVPSSVTTALNASSEASDTLVSMQRAMQCHLHWALQSYVGVFYLNYNKELIQALLVLFLCVTVWISAFQFFGQYPLYYRVRT